MSKFYPLTVKTVKKETPDSISIGFEIPANLQQEFRYEAGQYLTLRATVNGQDIRRAYSLCTSLDADPVPAVTVKRVPGGLMSNFLNEIVQEGSVIEVMPPQGRFVPSCAPEKRRHIILLGGGSGITPLFGILKTVMLKEPNTIVTLIYGNRDPQSVIFHTALEEWRNRYPDRLDIQYYIDAPAEGWNGKTGMLTEHLVSDAIKVAWKGNSTREYFLCGPSGFMEEVKKSFRALQVPENAYHIEYFTSLSTPAAEKETIVAPAMEGSQVTVILEGKPYELHIKDNTTILQAGIKAGIDPPFSCEAGICSTCMAKVLEGRVSMDENNILSDDEVAKGYILTCQSHPLTPVVKVEYFEG